MTDNNDKKQLVWGAALALAGLGVFFRIPQVMPRLAQIEYFTSALGVVRFCFYLIGAVLIYGGSRKIYLSLKNRNSSRDS